MRLAFFIAGFALVTLLVVVPFFLYELDAPFIAALKLMPLWAARYFLRCVIHGLAIVVLYVRSGDFFPNV